VSATVSNALHNTAVEDFATITISTADGRVGTIQVGYAFPRSELKRHSTYLRIGANGTASIASDGSATFTQSNGESSYGHVDVDSDPRYGHFVDQVADRLAQGFEGLPNIRELEEVMAVIWNAYSDARSRAPLGAGQ
jgi:hypothetical protein